MKLIIALITLLLGHETVSASVPKLVIYIVVDQLRGDYLEYFAPTFGEGGIKRLLREGLVYQNVRFGYPAIDQANAYATLFTGTNPNCHGITGLRRYDFERSLEISSLYDARYLGNFTYENYSPANLLTTTIGDELKIASGGRSEVYAIAPDASSAILSSGHAANGVFWIDDINGKWATTTYYKNVPWYVERYNNGKESLTERADTLTWEPALPLERYAGFPYVEPKVGFSHSFRLKSADCYPRIKTSPFVNREVNRLAAQFFEYAGFGTRTCPDLLSLTFYAGGYYGKEDRSYTYEIQDLYHRLDLEIAELLQLIDKKVGLSNTLIILSGTGYFTSDEVYPESLQIPGGEFFPKRCTSLLNMYLMALYGQKSWVKGFHNNQIYLNRSTIEESGLSLSELQSKSASFIAEFSGVSRVTTDLSLRTGTWNEEMSDVHRGTYFAGRGDLIIDLKPGWVITPEPVVEPPPSSVLGALIPSKRANRPRVTPVRNNAVQTPLILMGSGIRSARIPREVLATEIAPTITHILRIRSPNGCDRMPLPEVREMGVNE